MEELNYTEYQERIKKVKGGQDIEKTEEQQKLIQEIQTKKIPNLKNIVNIDWLSINFKNLDPSWLLFLLCKSIKHKDVIEENFFHNENRGYIRGYSHSYSYLDTAYIVISYHPERPDMGTNLQITGKGCKLVYIDEIRELLKNVSAITNDYKCNRFDICYDDFNKIIPVKEMVEYTEKTLSAYIIKDGRDYLETRILRNSIRVMQNFYNGLTSKNLYFGKHTSARSFRLYDKKIEQKIDDIDYWYRFEIELRSNGRSTNADDAFKSLLEGTINHYDLFLREVSTIVRFLKTGCIRNNGYKINSNTMATAEYWTNFLNVLNEEFSSHNISYANRK